MVSFQCHSCGDVVKKPKLDQHQSRCHGGFDCIDCSTTFNTPAEYKSHTSCISEAEKYQKTLYKGPRTGNNRNYQQNSGPRGQGNNYNNNFSNGYQNQRGGYGGRPLWNQARNQATGANDTPLGTPRRMSPVAKVDEPEKSNSATDVAMEPAQMKEGEGKEKDKKRKPEDEPSRENGRASRKKVKVDENAVDSASIPLPQSPVEEKEKKKRKREKKDKSEAKEVNDDMAVDKEKKKKEKREKKKELGQEGELKEKKEKKERKDKKERKKEKSEK